MRKPRPASGLRKEIQKLSPEQYAAFHRMLDDESLRLLDMAARAQTDFGIKATRGALSNYYSTRLREFTLNQTGQTTQIRLTSFELLITCPQPGTVRILASELPPKALGGGAE